MNKSSSTSSRKPNLSQAETPGEVTEDRRGIAYVLGVLVQGTEIVRLIDRDAQSPEEVADLTNNEIHVLSKRNLESYLFSDEVLESLAKEAGKPDQD